MMRSIRDWNRLLVTSITAASLISIIGIGEAVISEGRIIATIGNAAFLSSYLLLHVFLSLMLLLNEERFNYKAGFFALSTGMIGVALFLTEARAGLIGLFGGLVVLSVLFLIFSETDGQTLSIPHKVGKRIGGILLGLFTVMSVFFILFPKSISPYVPNQLRRFTDVSLAERTAEGRFLTWRVAWEGWQERGITGWGIENFNILFNAHYDERLFRQEPWFDRAHNIIFDIGSSTGILGIFSYMILLGSMFFTLYRKWRNNMYTFWTSAVLAALLGGYVLQNMFTFDTITTLIPLWMIFAFVAVSLHDEKYVIEDKQKNKLILGGVVLLSVVLIPGWYYVNAAPMHANRAAHIGWETLRLGGGDEEAIQLFNKGLSYKTHGDVDIRRFFAEYVFEFLKQGGVRPDESLFRLMTQANEYMDENIRADPQNVKWYIYQGELYNLMAVRFDSSYALLAEEFYLKARALSSARPQIYLGLAEAYKRQGRIEETWQELDTVLEKVPAFLAAHEAAGITAIETENREREEQEVEWIITNGHEAGSLRDAYFLAERYGDAARIQEYIIHDDDLLRKDRATLYAQLAALYNLAGEKDKARQAAYAVLEFDPMRKDEVEAFLNTL